MAEGRFHGKVVIVTGGAGGQGSIEVSRFAAEGARVYACDLRDDQDVPDGVAKARLDVGSEESWAAVVDRVMSEEGRLDVLVNNAGISLGKGLIGTSLADFKAVLDVNLTGAFLGMQRCAPAMRRGGGGSIVNIGAAISMTGFYRAAYSASKWGLRGVSKAAALEFAPWKVRVNVVHPGLVHTPMATANSDLYQAIQDAVPTGVPTMPDEIATFVLFLASDACASITGADLPIDGGVAAAGSMTGFARELGLWEEPEA
jgi:3alpha(or 20beta)-hydroxysteroid dehydrogenase